ncbi:MAG: serine hydrolase domain-containing protein [Planctomycetota bacterium]
MKRTVGWLCVGVLMCVGVGCSSSNPPVFEPGASLDEKLGVTLEHLRAPGAVVFVEHAGEVLIDRAYGVADLESGEPMTVGHHFRVASITKPFVAVVLLQLADEGKVGLDDPVGRYVEGVPAGDRITLRMLAQHTSGLNNYIAHPHVKAAFASEPERQWTTEELKAFAFGVGAYFDPDGGGWMYSNTNYVLLGEVIEAVEGKPLGEVIRERVCEPLGLTGTSYTVESVLPEPYATGYQYGDESGPIFWKGVGEVAYDVTSASPSMWHGAGAMVSTLGDVRRFLKAVTEGELLSDAMFAAQMDWRDTGYPVDYQYGLGVIRYEGGVGHNGNVPGYQVTMIRHADPDVSIVVLTNLYSSPNYEEPANAMYFVVMRHLTGESYAPPGWDGW